MTNSSVIVIMTDGQTEEARQMNQKFEQEVIKRLRAEGKTVYTCFEAGELDEALRKSKRVMAVMVLCLREMRGMNIRLLDYFLLNSHLANTPVWRTELISGTVMHGLLRRSGDYHFDVARRTPANEFCCQQIAG